MVPQRSSALQITGSLFVATLTIPVLVLINTRYWGDPVSWSNIVAADLALVPAVILAFRWLWSRPAASNMSVQKLTEDLATTEIQQFERELRERQIVGAQTLPISWGSIRVEGAEPAVSEELAHRFRDFRSKRLVIVGEPGSGKSSAAAILALGLLRSRKPAEPVPVVLQLSRWNPTTEDIKRWIIESVAEQFYARDEHAPSILMEGEALLLILDGLDELPETSRGLAVRQINDLISSSQSLVLTCRLTEYDDLVREGGPHVSRAYKVSMNPLQAGDIISYLGRFGWPAGVSWSRVFGELRRKPEGPVSRALSTPLMLSSARQIFQTRQKDPSDLLNRRKFDSRLAVEDFLTSASIDAAYSSDQSRDQLRRYSSDEARTYLGVLAHHLHSQNEKNFAWWRLDHLLSPWVVPIFSLAIGLIFLFVATLLSPPNLNRDNDMRLISNGGFGLALSALLMVLWAYLPERRPRQLVFRWAGSARRSWAGFQGGLKLGMSLAVPMLLYQCLAIQISDAGWSVANWLLMFRVGGASVGASLILALALAYIYCFTGTPDASQSTNWGLLLRRDRTATIVNTAIAGLISAILLIPVSVTVWATGSAFGQWLMDWPGSPGEPDLGLIYGSEVRDVKAAVDRSVGWVAAMVLSGLAVSVLTVFAHAWPRYIVASSSLWLNGRRFPLQATHFLRDAVSRGVLRDAGGFLQFRHARVQQRLVNEGAVDRAESASSREGFTQSHRVERPSGRKGFIQSTPKWIVSAVVTAGLLAGAALLLPADNSVRVFRTGSVVDMYGFPSGRTFVTTDSDYQDLTGRGFGSRDGGSRLEQLSISTDRNISSFELRFWEVSTGRELRRRVIAQQWMVAPRRDVIATATLPGTTDGRAGLALWRGDGTPLGQALNDVNEGMFSPDGLTMAGYSTSGHFAMLVSTLDGSVKRLGRGNIDSVTFSADSKFVIAKRLGTFDVDIFSVESGAMISGMSPVAEPLYGATLRLGFGRSRNLVLGGESLDVSPDNRVVVVGSTPKAKQFWDSTTDIQVLNGLTNRPLSGRIVGVGSWSFSLSSGSVVLSGPWPKSEAGKTVARPMLGAYSTKRRDLWSGPDLTDPEFYGNLLVGRSKSKDALVSVDPLSGRIRDVLGSGPWVAGKVSRDGRFFDISLRGTNESQIFKTTPQLELLQTWNNVSDIYLLTTDGWMLVDGAPPYFQSPEGHVTRLPAEGPFGSTGSRVSPDDELFGWVDDSSHELTIVSIGSGDIIKVLKGHTDGIDEFFFGDDGQVLTSSRDGTVRAWTLR